MKYLKACPFCKGRDIGVGKRSDGLQLNDQEQPHPDRYLAFVAVCNGCGARGPIVKIEKGFTPKARYDAVETAAALWNGEAPA